MECEVGRSAHEGGERRTALAGIILGFVALWVVLDLTARLFGSFRGEAGPIVALVVLAAAVLAETLLTGCSLSRAFSSLGLRPPRGFALLASLALGAVLLSFFPFFAWMTEAQLALRHDWYLLLPGLFAQGGIAEETVFRGFLFRHLRRGRSFWGAAWLSAAPFVAVHLLLFTTLEFSVALAAVLVSLSLSFPFAWLFERSGNSIWPPAIVHFVVQGSIKLVDVPHDSFFSLAVAWMIIGALAPWLLFLIRAEQAEKA